MPIAEHTGSARLLTSWALAQAIRQMAQWRSQGVDISVAVNLSAPDIMDPQLVEEIQGRLREHAVQPSRLVLEITESAVMRDPKLAARHMQLLKLAGIRFAIDDFGTGHSSLAQLSRLPLDQLKIDRAFITHAHEWPADSTIVKSTIELAHNMGLMVIAEGGRERSHREIAARDGLRSGAGRVRQQAARSGRSARLRDGGRPRPGVRGMRP